MKAPQPKALIRRTQKETGGGSKQCAQTRETKGARRQVRRGRTNGARPRASMRLVHQRASNSKRGRASVEARRVGLLPAASHSNARSQQTQSSSTVTESRSRRRPSSRRPNTTNRDVPTPGRPLARSPTAVLPMASQRRDAAQQLHSAQWQAAAAPATLPAAAALPLPPAAGFASAASASALASSSAYAASPAASSFFAASKVDSLTPAQARWVGA